MLPAAWVRVFANGLRVFASVHRQGARWRALAGLCSQASSVADSTSSARYPSGARPASAATSGPDSHSLDAAALYRRYGPMVYRRILRFFNISEAEEIMHEVFLLVLENQHRFRGESTPSTWLYQITTNHCINRRRLSQRRRELLNENRDRLWYGDDYEHSRGMPIEASIFVSQLWAQLSNELVQVGVAYYVDGLSQGEIAKQMQVSRRTIGNRLQRIEEQARALARPRSEDAGATAPPEGTTP